MTTPQIAPPTLIDGAESALRHQTAIFKSLAARNATFLLALIWIASPVPRLRPIYNNNQAAEATAKIKGLQDSLSAEQRKTLI